MHKRSSAVSTRELFVDRQCLMSILKAQELLETLQNTVAADIEVPVAASVAVELSAGFTEEGSPCSRAREAILPKQSSSGFHGTLASIISEPEMPGAGFLQASSPVGHSGEKAAIAGLLHDYEAQARGKF